MRGFLKRRRRRLAVAAHLKQHGGFHFRGQPVVVPDDLDLGIQALIADGGYEAAECALIERFLPPNLAVIELGGCLGLVSSFVASRIAPETQAIVVEANPRLVEACRHNATLGGKRTRTELIAKAVAYNATEVLFDVRDNVHVSKLGSGDTDGATPVPAVTLSALIETLGNPDAYALICDIEGAEVDIIDQDLAALGRCALLVIELHPDAYQDHTVASLITAIEGAGLELAGQDENVYAFRRPEPTTRCSEPMA